MFEDNPMLSIDVKVWKFMAVILSRHWRVYAFVAPVCIMNALQFVYLHRMWGDLAPFILNTFFTAAIFDALLRTCLVVLNRDKFEAFMLELDTLYREIEGRNDAYANAVLQRETLAARKISVFNLTASFSDIIGALLYPLFSSQRTHPFGVAIPGVDITASPIYEILYVLQIPTPLVLTALYMPFVSLFASFAMFGKAALIILQDKLRRLCDDINDDAGAGDGYGSGRRSEAELYAQLKECIRYHARIARYVKELNSLVTYIVFVEFQLFGAIICSLLFCFNIIQSTTQIVSVIMYIGTMMYVLSTYYWQANELYIESLKVAEAAYAMQWYERSPRFKRTLAIFIGCALQPLKIMVGNIYPMTLVTYQSILNASYTYFTLLRGVYNK